VHNRHGIIGFGFGIPLAAIHHHGKTSASNAADRAVLEGTMMRHVVAGGAAIAAAALCVFGSATLRADQVQEEKLTYLTFSGPVQVPGAMLPAGTYRFKMATPTSTNVMRVLSQDGRQVYATFFTERSAPHLHMVDKPVVIFFEHVANRPDAIKEWIYAGEAYGYVFRYRPSENPQKLATASAPSKSHGDSRLAADVTTIVTPDISARGHQLPCIAGQVICR
jgi:hypothetical protein